LVPEELLVNDFDELLRRLHSWVGLTGNFDAVRSDEHLRLQLYRAAASRMDLLRYIDIVLADPDPGMGSAVLVEVIDSIAAHAAHSEFIEWSNTVLARVHDRSFVVRRIAEWQLFNSLIGGHFSQEELSGATDWLQRKVVAESNNIDALTLLADRGRTKRVRSSAANRLDRHPGRPATPLGN
jgi:hypothetical protein